MHTERALQPPTQVVAPALTLAHYPPLVAVTQAGAAGGECCSCDGRRCYAHLCYGLRQCAQLAPIAAPMHRGVGPPMPRATTRREGGMRMELRRATA